MLFKNAWYVVALSSSVTARPQRVRALLQDLVLYRRASDQQVVALSDLCARAALIPCPARRQVSGWVLDEAPLTGGRSTPA